MRRNRQSLWSSTRLSIAVSAAAGLCTVMALTALFSAFTLFLMDSMEFSGFFAVFSLAAGALVGGYICGRFRRRRGLAEGLICGIVMYAAIGAVSLIVLGELPGIKKLPLLAFFCAAGGVYGVNSKRPKGLRSD